MSFFSDIFFFTSYEICSAQEFFNYNAALLGKEKQNNAEKISTILNSHSVKFSNTSDADTSSKTSNTLDIGYLDLSNLSQLNTAQFKNIKNCIVRISTSVTTINLNDLNQFPNLEIVHLIIETKTVNGNIPSLISMNNKQVLISYQISIPE
jgi:hypothetical protein